MNVGVNSPNLADLRVFVESDWVRELKKSRHIGAAKLAILTMVLPIGMPGFAICRPVCGRHPCRRNGWEGAGRPAPQHPLPSHERSRSPQTAVSGGLSRSSIQIELRPK